MSLETLVGKYDTFQKEVGEKVKELRKSFPPLFAALFEKHAWVEDFSWRQCEPWRDGDETEFEVLCDPDEIYINDENSWDNDAHENVVKMAAYKEFSEAIKEVPTEVMKTLFGESNEVEIRRSGEMLVREYSDG